MAFFSATVNKETSGQQPLATELTNVTNYLKVFDTTNPLFKDMTPATPANGATPARITYGDILYETVETFDAIVANVGAGVADLTVGTLFGVFGATDTLVNGTVTVAIDQSGTLQNLTGKTAHVGHAMRTTVAGTSGAEIAYTLNTNNATITFTSKDATGATETSDTSVVYASVAVFYDPA